MSTNPVPRTADGPLAGRWYQAFDFCLARAPLLPAREYPSRGRRQALELLERDDDARLAIAVSSLTLAARLEQHPPSGKRQTDDGLLRYAIRMTTRPTPFGLAAGVALARWGERTDLCLAARRSEIKARVDMVALLQLVMQLESRLDVRRALLFAANPAVHQHGGRVSLSGIESPTLLSGGENVSLRFTRAVDLTLDLARRPIKYGDLSDALVGSLPGASEDRVDELLESLWRHGFLISDLRPPLTKDPARHVAARLADIPEAADVGKRLQSLLERLAEWEGLPSRTRAGRFADLAAELTAISGSTTKTPLQVDMMLPLDGKRIARRVASEALRAAELLLELTPFPDGVPSIAAYRQAFEARYGFDRDVPLLELLDSRSGLGAPPEAATRLPTGREAQRERTLLAMATNALHERRSVVQLDRDAVESLRLWEPRFDRLPLSLDLYVSLAASSTGAIDAGDFELIVGANVGATAAGRNLGRFAEHLGRRGSAALAEVAAAEQALLPGRVFAEVTFLPDVLRTANVVIRPVTRVYEVGIPASATPTGATLIPLNQLYVRVSAGRFVLIWDTDPTTEVIPCAGHMLNHARAPAICRFLADLSRDGSAQLVGFDWGPARRFPFLPRVQSGRVVLHLAQWRLGPMLNGKALAEAAKATFGATFADWSRRWRVPSHVFLRNEADAADHRLFLDLREADHVEEVRRALRRSEAGGDVILQEGWPGLEQAWLHGPTGWRTAELVCSFVRRAPLEAAAVKPITKQPSRLTRLRPPGSDWAYLKLYCQRDDEDALISGPLRDFTTELTATERIGDWFYVRYSDPDPHVRLRLNSAGDTAVPTVCDWATTLLADEWISRFTLDTYEREVERYGGPEGMAISEGLFAADSAAVAEIIDLDLSNRCSRDRETVAMVSVDTLLAGMGLGAAERLEFYEQIAGRFRLAGERYRQEKNDFYRLLRSPSLPADLMAIISARQAAIDECAKRLRELDIQGRLRRTVPELCASYVHLHCNRLLGRDRGLERRVLELLLRTRRALAAGG